MGQNSTPIFNKNFQKNEIRGSFLKLIKNTYKELAGNIILNEERLKAFLLKWEAREGYPLSLLLFNIVLEILTSTENQET